jgi:hypothetical protein
VWTQSGKVQTNWRDRPDSPTNPHLPYIDQQSNLALIVYDPNDAIDLLETFAPDSHLGVKDFKVGLRWPTDFCSELEIGNYKLGRQTYDNESGYVAVYRNCWILSKASLHVAMVGASRSFGMCFMAKLNLKHSWPCGSDFGCCLTKSPLRIE